MHPPPASPTAPMQQPCGCECRPFQHSAAPTTRGKLAWAWGGWEKNTTAGAQPGVLGEAPAPVGPSACVSTTQQWGFMTRDTSRKMLSDSFCHKMLLGFQKAPIPMWQCCGSQTHLVDHTSADEAAKELVSRIAVDNTDLAQVAQVPTWPSPQVAQVPTWLWSSQQHFLNGASFQCVFSCWKSFQQRKWPAVHVTLQFPEHL